MITTEITRYKAGYVNAEIFRVNGSSEVVELNYEAQEHEDGGYECYVTRPDISNAADLLLDVTLALSNEGVNDITEIIWL